MILDTLISQDRLQYIKLHIFPIIEQTAGSVCEVGVYKGGSLSYFAQHLPGKEIIGIDTFEGLPDPCQHDTVKNLGEFTGHNKGDFGDTDYIELKKYFAENHPNVKLIKGCFPSIEILKWLEGREYSFVHVDCDLYKPVKDCCEYFYDRIVPSGAMLFDDYGFDSTPGAKIAVDEFIHNSNLGVFVFRALPTHQAVIFKGGA